jgi:Uma2 family endonuclease
MTAALIQSPDRVILRHIMRSGRPCRGLEPDQCYYIQHEALVREIEQIDLAQFPPPDLTVEVDITSSSLDRFSIYTELGIPEIWRYDGRSLTIYALQAGKYESCDRSIALPLLETCR